MLCQLAVLNINYPLQNIIFNVVSKFPWRTSMESLGQVQMSTLKSETTGNKSTFLA